MRLYSLIVLSVLLAGCSDQGVASQDANAPIKIEISQMYVTVRNESGLALNDVTVGIVPVGRTTIYGKFVGRIENAQSRNLMLGELWARRHPVQLASREATVHRGEGQRCEREGLQRGNGVAII
jgi:hypothetical protein